MEPLTMAAIYFGVKLLKAVCENWDSVVDTVVQTAQLAWSTVRDWLAAHRVNSVDVGNLVQTRLANGNYRVVSGLFTANGSLVGKTAWECSSVDAELQKRFSGKDRVTVKF